MRAQEALPAGTTFARPSGQQVQPYAAGENMQESYSGYVRGGPTGNLEILPSHCSADRSIVRLCTGGSKPVPVLK